MESDHTHTQGMIDIGPMVMSVPCDKLFAAFAEAQAKFGKIIKNVKVEVKKGGDVLYTHEYADMGSMIDACRAPLAEHGITVIQCAVSVDRGVEVSTTLTHASGQWLMVKPLHMPAGQGSPQALGSAITYARRYQYGPALGIVGEDDDGGAAEENARRPPPSKRGRPRSVEAPADRPRCSGAGAPIARSIFESATEIGEILGKDKWVVYRAAARAVVGDLGPYDGELPEPKRLFIDDGLAVKDALAAKLDDLLAPEREPGDDHDEDDPTDKGAP